MSHKQISIEIGRPESTVSAFCLQHFGYTRPDLIAIKQNGAHASDARDEMTTFTAPPAVTQNGTPQGQQRQSFLPSPRRSPLELTHEVRQSLRKHPTFCDVWHASECDVVEYLVARIRYQMGIPNVRELKRNSAIHER